MDVSLREYPRRRGLSHVAVMKAIKAGRLTPEPDGTLDPAKADAQWDDQTDPVRRPEPPEDEPAQADETPRASDPDKPGDVAAATRPAATIEPAPQGAATFTQARTAHEIAQAQRARIQVQRLREEVVDRAHATAEVFRLARRERDAWVNWPARVSALMAAELGVDTHAMHKVLEAHVRDHLGELAEIRPEFR